MRPGNSHPTARPAPRAAAPRLAAGMAGAVDLAAVKARAEAAQRAATAPPQTGAGSFVIEATEANFQTEVLDRSFQVPVLLDLWADWCEPCKQLSPLLERLATEYAGAWILATVDVEANQRIAQMLQVQSIPTVFAVLKGQLVPGFQGSLPEAQVREFLTALLEASAQAGMVRPPEPAGQEQPDLPPQDERFSAAEDALEAGDFGLAEQRYEAILLAEPANNDAMLALRQVHFLQRLSELPIDAIAVGDATPADLNAQLAAADAEFAANDIDAALTRLIATVRRTRGDERETVRQRLLEYFDLLGPDEPKVGPARRTLANALF